MKLRVRVLTYGLMAVALVLVPALQATLLTPVNPGDCQGAGCVPNTVQNTVQNNGGNPIGTLKADTGVVLVNGFNALNKKVFSADFREVVYEEAGGTLDFYYQVKVLNSPAGGHIQHITATDFTEWLAGVGTASKVSLLGSTGTKAPVNDGLSPDGSEASFNFTPPGLIGIGAGQTSFTLLVSTNALTWQPGSISLIDGATANVVGFEPGPEPASIVLFGTVLAFTGLIVRRRLAAKQ